MSITQGHNPAVPVVLKQTKDLSIWSLSDSSTDPLLLGHLTPLSFLKKFSNCGMIQRMDNTNLCVTIGIHNIKINKETYTYQKYVVPLKHSHPFLAGYRQTKKSGNFVSRRSSLLRINAVI